MTVRKVVHGLTSKAMTDIVPNLDLTDSAIEEQGWWKGNELTFQKIMKQF